MNKYVMEALSGYNFTYNKNTGYGYIDGFEVNVINNMNDIGPMFLFSTFLSQSQKNEFVLKVNNLKIKMLIANYFEFGVVVKIGAMTAKGFVSTSVPLVSGALSKSYGVGSFVSPDD